MLTMNMSRSGDVDGRGACRYGDAMSTTQTPLTLRRWRRTEYERLIELGVFQGEPIELIAGDLVVAEPQAAYHASALTRVDYTLRAVLPDGWLVRVQAPISLDEDSQPEPDLVVVRGQPGDYERSHPTRPVLVVEIADSSLEFDRRHKGSLYARAGIDDYWIVNLPQRVLEVYRDATADIAAVYGWRYGTLSALTPGATITPLALPSIEIPVASLLPR
jgi:Uma2 family endonuclease